MPIARIFQNTALNTNDSLRLDENASHHLARVLRYQVGDQVTVFNNRGGEYLAIITQIDKKNVHIQVQDFNPRESESPLELFLVQGVSRGEKMDYTIQKAVELGVKKIIPVLTERSTVKLDAERREKRLQHWQSIIISACEQSGRNTVPDIIEPQTFTSAIHSIKADLRFILAPTADKKLSDIGAKNNQSIALFIGPEGGFTEDELKLAFSQAFLPLNLGPRVLRTETAAIAAITALQCYFGDMK